MLKRLAAVVLTLALAGLTSPAFAASPHYIRGPAVTVGDNSLTVSWKAAGLGNTTESADFNLAGTVDTSSQCFTKSGNPVNGVPKQETIQVNESGTFPVRNGSVTGSLTVEPLTTLECTGNQEARLLSVAYDLTLTGNDLPPVSLTG